MDLDRQSIERTDFSQTRRGYDPDEVESHLRQIADAIQELRDRQDAGSASGGSVAGAAADQVRTIVAAAERSAGEIEASARAEADRVTGEATRDAQQTRSAAQAEADRVRSEAAAAAHETRERAEADARSHVEQVEQATGAMRARAESVHTDLGGLVEELRATITTVVESVRSNAGSLEIELAEIKSGLADVREAAPEPELEPAPVAIEPEAEGGVWDEPEAFEEDDDVEAPGQATRLTETLENEEPESEAAEAEPEPAGEGAEGARLIALNMALNGTPREETAKYLDENFDLVDQDQILDEVYARVGG